MTTPPLTPSLPRRLAALLYDLLLVIALVAAVNAVAWGIAAKVTGNQQLVLSPGIVRVLTLGSGAGFFGLFWVRSGQTLGMRAWRIRLVNDHGQQPSMSQALLRSLGAMLSAACLGLGYLWCLVDRDQRYWHDRLSRTHLVLDPPRGKKQAS